MRSDRSMPWAALIWRWLCTGLLDRLPSGSRNTTTRACAVRRPKRPPTPMPTRRPTRPRSAALRSTMPSCVSLQSALANRGDADSLAASALFERAYVGYSSGDSLDTRRAGGRRGADARRSGIRAVAAVRKPRHSAMPRRWRRICCSWTRKTGSPGRYALLRAERAQDPAARAAAFYGLAQIHPR